MNRKREDELMLFKIKQVFPKARVCWLPSSILNTALKQYPEGEYVVETKPYGAMLCNPKPDAHAALEAAINALEESGPL